MSLQWTKALSVGISEIDDQHKELFGRINKMLNIIVESSEIDETGKVIDFLDEYVVSHFATEEGLMKRFDYPIYSITCDSTGSSHGNSVSSGRGSVRKGRVDFLPYRLRR